jgi:probable F420-dependent oxidoreductase
VSGGQTKFEGDRTAGSRSDNKEVHVERTALPMRIGVALPQEATRADPIAVRDFAQAVKQLGYAHLEVYDHVLGASREAYLELDGPYCAEHAFYEPFVLFGYLAGHTHSIELVTGVIVLAQRQTALVAKQAAIVDVLSGGRLRLGIGTGWNPVEFEALGENFHNRGRRSEEQIAALRALWTEEAVTFRGEWHTITEAGINPLPVQRPIPLWIGGHVEGVAERCGRLDDGWIAVHFEPDDDCRTYIGRIRDAARQVGRDPNAIGLEAWVSLGGLESDDWAAQAEAWHGMGMTHLTANTEFDVSPHRASSARTVDEHIALLERYRDIVGELGVRVQ